MRNRANCRTDGSLGGFRPSLIHAFILAPCIIPTPAFGQIAASVTLASSDVFRGESTSGNDPALSLSVSADHSSGLFAGASVTAAAGDKPLRINGASQYVGFAHQLGTTALEIGLIHRSYGSQELADEDYRKNYFEAFVGLNRPNLRLRLYMSPNYLRDSRNSFYGEVNGRLLKKGSWSLNGHAGISMLPADPGQTGMRFYEDWSLQVSRPLGKFSVSAGLVATNYAIFEQRRGVKIFSNPPRFVASISRSF